jgi:transcriptional regulator with XRE-family HTH domain
MIVYLNDVGHARRRPKRLAGKLLQIRKALGVSQHEMAERLRAEVPAKHISNYERDRSVPPIEVVLAYARVANVPMDQIIDDKQELTLEL